MADRPVRNAALSVEDALQIVDVFAVARRRDARHGGLEHTAHVQQLVLQIVAVAEDGGQRRHQPVDVQLLRKRALTVPRDEQTNRLERTKRVADRPAADAEPFGERALGGQRPPRRERAVENQHADAVGDLLGDARLSDWLDEAELGAGGAPPGGVAALDSPGSGCQTHPPNWLDHRATLTYSS
jgi:hypothetical protein